jgi:hypothetical protein
VEQTYKLYRDEKTCCKVEKTYERGASEPEVLVVSSGSDGAEREQTQGDAGVLTGKARGNTLKSAKAQKRTVTLWNSHKVAVDSMASRAL